MQDEPGAIPAEAGGVRLVTQVTALPEGSRVARQYRRSAALDMPDVQSKFVVPPTQACGDDFGGRDFGDRVVRFSAPAHARSLVCIDGRAQRIRVSR
jgi:hypothetical protein